MTTLTIHPDTPFELGAVPETSWDAATRTALARRDVGERLAALFAEDDHARGSVRIWFVFAAETEGVLRITSAVVPRTQPELESLTPQWTQAHLFEREIAEQFGIGFRGHPWFKPVRGAPPLTGPDLFPPPEGARCRLDAYPFLRADSEEMHEVAVGPVHAGIIEPGHFRFLCHGEEIDHLEISLGYQHRGVERRIAGAAEARGSALAESIAGDSAIGHATAHCQVIEGLADARVGLRAQAIRGIALELERCANHVGDLGALAGDVGHLPSAAYFGRLRGDFLNMLTALSGNRYGRGLVRRGGVGFDIDAAMSKDFEARLKRDLCDFVRIAALLFQTPSVSARFEGTGRLERAVAEEFGAVGPAARASGCERDVRRDFPTGVLRFAHIPLSSADTCDVAARALVRRLETERSIEFLLDQIGNLPTGGVRAACGAPAPEIGCVVLTEGWRGEIVHVALTDAAGRVRRYKIVDPSFRNWAPLAMSLRGVAISDFPLCNKSFNLSYAGHDL